MENCKHIFKRLVLGVVVTFLLAACGRGSADLCVYADDFGDIAESRKTVYSFERNNTRDVFGVLLSSDGWPPAPATGSDMTVASINNMRIQSQGWVSSDIRVASGKNMRIQSRGSVDLCTMDVLVADVTMTVDPTVNDWQVLQDSSGADVNLLSYHTFTLEVSGSFSQHSDGSNPYSGGDSLFAYIGNAASSPTGLNWGDAAHMQYGGAYPQYFELNEAAVPSGTAATVPATGNIQFRVSDDRRFWGSNSHYDDNVGGYQVRLRVWDSRNCEGEDGEFLVARIGEDPTDTANSTEISLHDCTTGHSNCGGRSNGVYTGAAPASGLLWFKIVDDEDVDWDRDGSVDNKGDGVTTRATFDPATHNPTSNGNAGSYIVDTVAVQEISGGLSSVINTVIDPLKDTLMGEANSDGVRTGGLTETMYNGITSNGDYIQAARAAMTLVIVIFAFSYMAGLSKITQKELLALTLRLAFIVVLISPTSWEFFRKYLFFFFLEGTEELIMLMSSQFTQALSGATTSTAGVNMSTSFIESTASNTTSATASVSVSGGSGETFDFLNQTLARFFTKETNSKIAGVLNSWPFGIIYALMIYIGMFYFLFAVGKAMILYMISIIMVSLMLFLAPIFIPFMLFERTRPMFDGWIKQLINFSLQPILLFMMLSIFNVFVYSVFTSLLSFTVCWSCVAEIDLPLNTLLGITENFDKFCLAENYKGWGASDGGGLGTKLANSPVGLFMILIFLIMVNAMVKFTDWIVEVAGSIAAASSKVGLGSAASSAIQQTTSTVATTVRGTAATAKIGAGVAKGTTKFASRKTLGAGAKGDGVTGGKPKKDA